MIHNNKLDFLKSKPEDKKFHISRIMFCIRDGRIEVAQKNTTNSHMEWFENEGWITNKNVEDFLKQNTRGYYFPDQNKLYCYRGIGFYFDDDMQLEILKKISDLKKILNLNGDTEIHLGPKDAFFDGMEHKRTYLGTLGKLIKTS